MIFIHQPLAGAGAPTLERRSLELQEAIPEDTVWLDMIRPTREEDLKVEAFMGIQVPTREGWVFVSPYMTLVSAYERLLGERGTELVDAPPVADGDPAATGSVGDTTSATRHKTPQWAKNRNKAKSQRRQRYAGR